MDIQKDNENDGIKFKIHMNKHDYSGIITLEALQGHFDIGNKNLQQAITFFDDKAPLLENEICTALHRHPPVGRHHILILPHHMR